MSRNRSDDNYFLPLFSGAVGAARARFRTEIPARTYTPYVPETLGSARTYYVNTATGNDSRDGLTSGTAWRTYQHAINVVDALNLNTFTVTILGTGTGNESLVCKRTTNGKLKFSGGGVSGTDPMWVPTGSIILSGFSLNVTGNGSSALYASGSSVIETRILAVSHSAGVLPRAAIELDQSAQFSLSTNRQIGSHGAAWDYFYLGQDSSSATLFNLDLTLSNTPAYGQAFAAVDGASIQMIFNSLTGTATGKRYQADNGGSINTSGGGANYFPGNVAGTTSGGGTYA